MTKTCGSLILVLALITAGVTQTVQQPQELKSGLYMLSVPTERGKIDLPVVLNRKGHTLELMDALTRVKYRARIIDYKIWGMTETSLQTASFKMDNRKSSLEFEGQLNFAVSKGGHLMATWESKNEQEPVRIRALAALWLCGNHTGPTHSAESEPERNEKTNKHGCSNWYQVTN